MGATLDALHRLQAIENKLRSVRGQIDAKRRSAQARKRKLSAFERQIAQQEGEIKQAQTQADRLELERKNHEQHADRLREALNQAKTNKEYAAILTELNTHKADMSKVEDTALGAMTRVDDLKSKMADTRSQLERERKKVVDIESEAEELERKRSAELKELENKRADAAENVPPEALAMFERACERHDGEAMAMLERTHPRSSEYICSGCNMSVTLETVNALQSRNEALACHTCSRVLYLDAPASVSV